MTEYHDIVKRNKSIIKYTTLFIITIVFIAGITKLYALTFVDSHVSPITTANIIYKHTQCQLVINKNPWGYSMMIPTKYANEWSTGAENFASNSPAGVTVLPCTNVAYTWGWNTDGQVGNATVTPLEDNPVITFAINEWKKVVAGGKQACGIYIDNSLYCWGYNWSGKLGIGNTTAQNEPTLVSGGYLWKDIGTIRGNHICGITTTNQAYCWGANRNASTGIIDGRLGSGDVTVLIKKIPTLVSGGYSWKEVSAGSQFSCGITTSDEGYCWGHNNFGQNGDNTTTIRHVPTLISGGYSWKQVSSGSYHTCGITTGNQAYCWGLRESGRIGDSIMNGSNRETPSLVSGGHSWKKISSGGQHSCGITDTDEGYCWGNATDGILGNGVTTGSYATPQLIQGEHSWSKIHASDSHTCGLTTNDKIYCWGNATGGILGNGVTTGLYSTPTLIRGEYSWKDISVGEHNTIGIQKNHRTDKTSAAGVSVSASSTFAGHSASQIMDDHDSKGWLGNGSLPHTVQVDFGATSSNVITEYTLYRSSLQWRTLGWYPKSPTSWKLQASNDTVSWTDLDTQSGQVIVNNESPTSYTFTNTVAYRYYRLYITAGNGGSNLINISEIEMSESDL